MQRLLFSLLILGWSSTLFSQETLSPEQKADSIRLWVSELAADSTVDTEVIGTGQFSLQYMRYDKLVSTASDTVLMDLTDHQSPAVRLYAYYGLTRNQPSLLVEALRNHPDDSALVLCRNGAIENYSRVYEEAVSWAVEFLVRGNPKGLSRADKEFVHSEYMQILMQRRERSRAEKEKRRSEN